jgi:hypothetical protein
MRKYLTALLLALFAFSATAYAEPMRVLWWDISLEEAQNKPSNRRTMAQFVDGYKGGAHYDVDYKFEPRRGALARHVSANPGYQIVVITAANHNALFNDQDFEALRGIYQRGHKALMLDGSLGIRNSDVRPLTKWPGVNNASANMLINQVEALREAGGGFFIGTDHGRFQRSANLALNALVPGAAFSRVTNPSRDGDFFGDLLLAKAEPVKPLDMLRHWEAIPNQGQAPVGSFTDFTGAPVTLYTLVEASDKPGGGTRRPYVSSTIDPGDTRVNITEDAAPVINRMPTRKSLPSN